MVNIKELIGEYLDKLNVNSVLDVGCGKGGVSLRFARRGIKVTGIDRKDFEIKNENFNFVLGDIKDFGFKEKYDLIVVSFFLHFFEYKEAIEIIRKIQVNTNKKGFNFLVCLNNLDDLAKQKPNNFYPSFNELEKLYEGWEIVRKDQILTELKNHNNLEEHRHNTLLFLAKKII